MWSSASISAIGEAELGLQRLVVRAAIESNEPGYPCRRTTSDAITWGRVSAHPPVEDDTGREGAEHFDLDGLAWIEHHRSVEEHVGGDRCDQKRAMPRRHDRSARGQRVRGRASRGGDDDSITREGGEGLAVDQDAEPDRRSGRPFSTTTSLRTVAIDTPLSSTSSIIRSSSHHPPSSEESNARPIASRPSEARTCER